MKIALQLYSVRDYVKTPEELKGTLRKVKECGYDYVETAGFYGMTAGELRVLLDNAGLSAVSTHTGLPALWSGFDQVLRDQEALGACDISVPWMPDEPFPRTVAGFSAFGESMDICALKLKKEGLALSYHNHDYAFTKPISHHMRGMDILLASGPNVFMQLDTGNAYLGGVDPAGYVWKYLNRISTIHFKDIDPSDKHDSAVGEGALDFSPIAEGTKAAGAHTVIIEVERFRRDAFDELKASYDFTASLF